MELSAIGHYALRKKCLTMVSNKLNILCMCHDQALKSGHLKCDHDHEPYHDQGMSSEHRNFAENSCKMSFEKYGWA